MVKLNVRDVVIGSIERERVRQNELFGEQKHDYGTWLMILMEEVGEVAQAMQSREGFGWGKDSDASNLYDELVQVAAVAAAIAESILLEGEE